MILQDDVHIGQTAGNAPFERVSIRSALFLDGIIKRLRGVLLQSCWQVSRVALIGASVPLTLSQIGDTLSANESSFSPRRTSRQHFHLYATILSPIKTTDRSDC